MRKKTVYNVTGVLDIKPENLPDGLKVDELEVDVLEVLEIGPFHFADSAAEDGGVYIREDQSKMTNRHLTKEQTRELRDFLNKILDETTPMRVMQDSTGDFWFELQPNLFTYGSRWSDVGPLEEAKKCLAHPDDTAYASWTLEKLRAHYGTVVDVTGNWNQE